MSLTDNLWYLGAQFMASIQARDNPAAQRQLKIIRGIIEKETHGKFSHCKLRALQVLTNANRAAFTAGASTDRLAEHSREIVAAIDQVRTKGRLGELTRKAVEKTIRLVPESNAYKDRVVREAIAYIRGHYSQAITREELAARLQCSAAHFSRLFSKTTGYSYKDFLLQCRLERAKVLLERSHLQVAEIAEVVGFQDPFHFSKVFRKRVGVSPRQFRASRIGGTCGPAAGRLPK
ncbi:MAG: AraC family transcriptional regulator [Opitutus sp.]|nr:AraC family transcriptional regulator [Opitutus sp.]